MLKNSYQFTYLTVLKKYSTNKILTFGIILLFMISSLSAAYPQNPNTFKNHSRAIVWDVTLNFNELGGTYDYTIFGEAPDARDGPPADTYDTVKPPAPILPCIRAWFNDSLPSPYDSLWKDYRHYPALYKIWNLTVQWLPSSGSSPTTVTMFWNITEFVTSEYTAVILYTAGGTPLQNMLVNTSYIFSCPAYVPQAFKIKCVVNHGPNAPSNPSPSNGSVTVSVNADLSWICSDPDGDPLTYDVYFGTSISPPKIVSNISASTCDPGTLSYGTVYYWKIIAWDSYRAKRLGPVWHFQTNNMPNQPSNPNPSNSSTSVSVNTDLYWNGGGS